MHSFKNNSRFGSYLYTEINGKFFFNNTNIENAEKNSFGWNGVHTDDFSPNIYRSAKSLPKDLERLLMKLESENLDSKELTRLRVRLEQTEKEMTSILNAMQATEQTLKKQHRNSDLFSHNNIAPEQHDLLDENEESITDEIDDDDGIINDQFGGIGMDENTNVEFSVSRKDFAEETNPVYVNSEDEEYDDVDSVSDMCIRQRALPVNGNE